MLSGCIAAGLARKLPACAAAMFGVWIRGAAAEHLPPFGTARQLVDAIRTSVAVLQATDARPEPVHREPTSCHDCTDHRASWAGRTRQNHPDHAPRDRANTRGYRVSTIKHAHVSFDVDHPGRDSHRHRAAGAVEVAIASPTRWAVMHEPGAHQSPPCRRWWLACLPATSSVEGYKRGPHAKVEVRRHGARQRDLDAPRDAQVIAVVSDTPDSEPDPLPVFGAMQSLHSQTLFSNDSQCLRAKLYFGDVGVDDLDLIHTNWSRRALLEQRSRRRTRSNVAPRRSAPRKSAPSNTPCRLMPRMSAPETESSVVSDPDAPLDEAPLRVSQIGILESSRPTGRRR